MRRVEIPILVVIALGVRPAQGHQPLSDAEKDALTLIDTVVTKQQLVEAFQGEDAGASLTTIATDSEIDFGVRLRAIRSLPFFCAPPCAGSAVHIALVGILQVPAQGLTGQSVLLRRAAMEALGVARSGDPADVTILVSYLNHSSRDLRATAAHSLRDLCNTQAVPPLRARYQVETVEQVRLAISTALRDLDGCAQ